MRALRHHAFGRPADVLRLDEVPTPEPAPDEVRVRLTHRSINPADLGAIRGGYGVRPALPAIGGNEGVGYVESLGNEVRGLQAGQRVIPLGAGGTWCEGIVAAPDDLFGIPDAVPDEAAAQLYVNPLTAWLMLAALDLGEGDWLIQTAATSQVGRLVIQLARRRGIRTANLVRRPAPELDDLGADLVFVADGSDPGVGDRLREAVGGGAAGALDAVGGSLGGLVAGCLRDEATMLVYGALGGEPLALSPRDLIFRRVTVRGFWRTKWAAEAQRGELRTALAQLAMRIADGHLTLPVAASYDLAEFEAALDHIRTPGRGGKVLFTG